MAPTFAFQQKNDSPAESDSSKNQVTLLSSHSITSHGIAGHSLTNRGNGKTQINNSARTKVIGPKSIESSRDHLYVILQTSLDLDELLELFKKEIEDILTIDSCRYSNRALDINIGMGNDKRNKCTYRLITQDSYLGELIFSRKKKFTNAEVETLETLICTVIYPIRNALRYREAMHSALTDALTGVGNRVSLNQSLSREFELANRYQQPLSLLMIDLDHFKAINDKYGHAAGDKVLQLVAKEIQKNSRCADMTFRYGGEEFVVLLNKTDEYGAAVIAERIRTAISNILINLNDIEISVTTSIGCTTLRDGDSADSFLQKADKALYEAKDGGRNQVCTAAV